jgi:hypothetical protein
MVSRPTRFDLVVLVASLFFIGSSDASAYIDPGAGSYLFQLIIAGGLAGLYTVRKYWSTLRTSLLSKFRRGSHDASSRPDGMD